MPVNVERIPSNMSLRDQTTAEGFILYVKPAGNFLNTIHKRGRAYDIFSNILQIFADKRILFELYRKEKKGYSDMQGCCVLLATSINRKNQGLQFKKTILTSTGYRTVGEDV
jgi:hypothetical protein